MLSISQTDEQKKSINKLTIIGKQVIKILKENDEGIRTDDIADIIKVPKRRVYDVIAILKASNLVDTNRDKNGTIVRWKASAGDINPVFEINSKKILIKTSGHFTKVVNKGTEVEIVSTEAYITIENM